MKHSSFHVLSHDKELITYPKQIADVFNDYFSTITENTKAKIKYYAI